MPNTPSKGNAKISSLQTWKTTQGTVTIFMEKEKPHFVIDTQGGKKIIPNHCIHGLPKEVLKNETSLIAFLKDTYLQVSQNDGEYTIRINHRLKGGANIINPTTQASQLWPSGIVPFEIDLARYPVGQPEREIILQAINEWNEANTGFTFVPRTDQTDYLIFGEEEGVCYSNVGRQGGRQYIRCDLDGGGFNKRSIKHEMGHAIGFYHEHQRYDRDNYVAVARGADRTNYGRTPSDKMYGEYDFNSIMHYFLGGKINIRPDIRLFGEERVGTQDRLSEGDLAAARYLASFAHRQTPTPTRTFMTGGAYPSRTGLFQPIHSQLKSRAAQAMRHGNYDAASDAYLALYNEYQTVVNSNEVSQWCLNYGYCRYKCGDLSEAKAGFEQALSRDTNNQKAHNNLAIVNDEIRQLSQPQCVLF